MTDAGRDEPTDSLWVASERVLDEEGSFAAREQPSSSGFDGEDFLYHLYRGSELLQDNYVSEAKEELERALALQPQDVEGQGLLGVVYFRLGLYPRAIRIYEDIVRSCPTEITPRVNLGLCYLKTGQHLLAREVLEEVIRRVPDHTRAWGYLGLVYEREGDYDKALAAFHEAGHQQMARRMEQLLVERATADAPDLEPSRAEVRHAAADAIVELEEDVRPFARSETAAMSPALGRWHSIEPGQERMPPARRTATRTATPAPVVSTLLGPAELAALTSHAVGQSGTIAVRGGRFAWIQVDGAFVARQDSLRALLHEGAPFRGTAVARRARGRDLDEPLGGSRAPLIALDGRGRILLACPATDTLRVVRLAQEFFYVREERLIGFDGALRHESGRIAAGGADHASVVQLSGEGALLFRAGPGLSSVDVSADAPAIVRGQDVVGWTGRLLGQPSKPADAPAALGGFVTFTGDGALFIDASP